MPSRFRMAALASAVAATVAATVAACGEGSDSAEDRATEMLANLPGCERVELGDDGESLAVEVAGLVLPDGTHVESVLDQGPLTTVEGTVRMTPLDLRAHYEERSDIEVLRAEDETFEAELLVRTEGHRMYVRAAALCADGTAVTAVVGPDSDDADLPEFQSDE